MFDLVAGNTERPLRERAPISKVVSLALHAIAVTLVVGIPVLRMADALPEAPTIMAFVAPGPAPPPRPPPPLRAAARSLPRPVPKPPTALAAPVDAPSSVRPEPTAGHAGDLAAVDGGAEGGVEGGVPGGIVGGLVAAAPPPPAPPPPAPPSPARQGPVRVGGQLQAPALVHRVEPTYPAIASTKLEGGVVILEAVVDVKGCVESVRVLRSAHPLLGRAAIDALRQWQYSPLVLNGIPTSFVLTVLFNFSVG